MSTLHEDAAVSSGSDKKTTVILNYHKNIGGVDNLDKLTVTYTCQPMTRRWPMVVFYNILDVSACNAFLLWTHIHQGWNYTKKTSRECFLRSWETHERRERVLRDPDAAAQVRQMQRSPSTPSTPSASSASPDSTSSTTATTTTSLRPPDSKRGVRSAPAVRTERPMYCASTATISLQRTH